MPKASAMYKITASDPLPAPVKVRMQHCAVLEEEDSLVHIVAHDRDGPPYHFELLPGGKFPLGSSCGEIELSRFSFLAIMLQRLGVRLSLAIHVFYLKDSTAKFVVTKHNPDKIAAVKDEYKDAIDIKPASTQCKYTTEAITLSIPDPVQGEWDVSPTYSPAKINMDDICGYRRGRIPPGIELNMEWNGEGESQKKNIKIGITGGELQSFILFCRPKTIAAPDPQSTLRQANPTDDVLGAVNTPLPQPGHTSLSVNNDLPHVLDAQESCSEQDLDFEIEELRGTSTNAPVTQAQPKTSTAITQQSPPSKSDKPNLMLLLNFPTQSGENVKIIQSMASQHHHLIITLLNDNDGTLTESIVAENHYKTDKITLAVLSRWLQGEGREPKTWATLITVLREIELSELAGDIEKNMSNP